SIAAVLAISLLTSFAGDSAAAAAAKSASKPTEAKKASASKKTAAAPAKKADPDSLFRSGTFSGLAFRSLGPAVTSGRVGDVPGDPVHPATWFVAAASGGVWKTESAGTTWSPVFDGE